MFTALAHLDEQNVINNLPMFLAASPDGLPSARLMEGDLEIVWTKLTNLGDLISEIINANKQYLNVTKSNTDILLRLEQDVAALKADLPYNRASSHLDTRDNAIVNRRRPVNGAKVRAVAEC